MSQSESIQGRGKQLNFNFTDDQHRAMLRGLWSRQSSDVQWHAIQRYALSLPPEEFKVFLDQNSTQDLKELFYNAAHVFQLSYSGTPEDLRKQSQCLNLFIDRMSDDPQALLSLGIAQMLAPLLNVEPDGRAYGRNAQTGFVGKNIPLTTMHQTARDTLLKLFAAGEKCPDELAATLRLSADNRITQDPQGVLYEMLKQAARTQDLTLFKAAMEALPAAQRSALLSQPLRLHDNYEHGSPQLFAGAQFASQGTFKDKVNRGGTSVREAWFVSETFNNYTVTPSSLAAGYPDLKNLIDSWIITPGEGVNATSIEPPAPKLEVE